MGTLNMDFDKRKYNGLEPVLQQINQECISLPEELVRKNNNILNEVISLLTYRMKQVDSLFNLLFTTIFYGGSYFDGLKVGSPEEYDLDLLLELPKFSTPTVTNSNIPGFMHVQLETFERLAKQPEFEKYKAEKREMEQKKINFQNQYNYNYNNNYNRNYNRHYYKTKLHLNKTQKLLIKWLTETRQMEWHLIPTIRALLKLVDERFYLLTSKVSSWFEGVIDKALKRFPMQGNRYVLNVRHEELTASVHKEGPAFTLKIIGRNVRFDVDLVPCFVFKRSWPEGDYRKNPFETSKPDFFIVPKRPKQAVINKLERYWRLSFQEQERALINGYPKLKPALKLLKRLRDNLNRTSIASYYIKTLFLWEIDQKNTDIFKQSLSYAFMKMLYILQIKIEKREIPYFWNKKNNLIGNINPNTLTDIGNQLRNIIKDINNNLDEPNTIVKYLNNDSSDDFSDDSFDDSRDDSGSCILL